MTKYEGVKDFGKVWACPVCKRGNVAILHIFCYGPEKFVLSWTDQKFPEIRVEKEDSQLFYDLECGHRILSKDALEPEKPKFVRWYPEGELCE